LRPCQMPVTEDMDTTRKIVAANVNYLDEIGFFAGDGQGELVGEVFARSKR
jgi:hypothetical protein